MATKKFNVDEVHAEQQKKNIMLKQSAQQGKHLQEDMRVDISASYKASIARLDKSAPDYDEQVAHIEAVLSSGNFRHAK
jgi:hypothetical protein